MTKDKIKVKHKRFGGDYPREIIEKLVSAAKKYEINPYAVLAIAMQESNMGKTRPNYGVDLVDGLDPEQQDRKAYLVDRLKRVHRQLKKHYGKRAQSQQSYLEDFDFLDRGYEIAKFENDNDIADAKKQLEASKDKKFWKMILRINQLRAVQIEKRKKEAAKNVNFIIQMSGDHKAFKPFLKQFNLEDGIQQIAKEPTLSEEDRLAKVLKYKINYGQKLGKKSDAELLQAFNGYGKVRTYKEGVKNTEKSPPLYGKPAGTIDFNKTPLYGERAVELMNTFKNNDEIKNIVEGG